MSDQDVLSPVSPNVLPSVMNLCPDQPSSDDFTPEQPQVPSDRTSIFDDDSGNLPKSVIENLEDGEVSYQRQRESAVSQPQTSTTPTEGRPRRARKRKCSEPAQKVPCPICGTHLKPSEVDGHIETEVYRLEKAARNAKSKFASDVQSIIHDTESNNRNSPEPVPGTSREADSCDSPQPWRDSPARYKSYLRVKTNRERRAARRTKKPNEEETNCPVCNRQIIGLPEELADHVDACLRSSEQSIDVVGDEVEDDFTYEEYTWAGQTRIRTSTMLPGGLGGSGFQVNRRAQDEDDDVELDVEGDDDVTFGNEQYTEGDLIPCDAEEQTEEQERSATRNVILGNHNTDSDARVNRPGGVDIEGAAGNEVTAESQATSSLPQTSGSSSQMIIESLKAKIREQAKVISEMSDVPKCLICMEKFNKPVTSVQCWHVHCENCWLKTLGAKKLCPQCNMITSPSDLRRIYL